MGKLKVGMRVKYNDKLLERCERFKDTETRLRATQERGTLVKLWGGRDNDRVALVDWGGRGKDTSLSTYLEEDNTLDHDLIAQSAWMR